MTLTRPDFDVAVVGGGPAGTSAACALAKAGARVLLLERTRYDAVRFGETLPGACKLPLGRLGAWERFASAGHRRAPCVLSAWGSAELGARDSVFDPHGEGFHVDRRAFDEMLSEVAREAGVQIVHSARVTRLSGDAGAFRLEVQGPRGISRPTAARLVDATGRAASVARRLGARREALDALVGCVAFAARATDSHVAAEATLLEATRDGWWYSAPLPSDALVVAFMTDADLLDRGGGSRRPALDARLLEAPHTASRVAAGTLLSPRVISARSLETLPAAGDGWLSVGDAALAMDPLSSGGVYEALVSGLAAAELWLQKAAARTPPEALFAAAIAERAASYRRLRTRYYAAERRWPDAPFWRRRLALTLRAGAA